MKRPAGKEVNALYSLYRFLRSIRLAVVLILIIAALSILSTLIPQGNDAAFYFHKYGAFWARLILALDLHDLFRSMLFLIPVAVFFINLTVCAVDRLVGRKRRKARRRHGPDLIHLGLLLLIIGAMFSVFGRREGLVYMGEGDEIQLPGQYVLRLVDYEYQEYEDGRPKDWISTVEVRREGEVVIDSFPIEVNKPLRVGGIKVYQTSFAREYRALMQDREGTRKPIAGGQGFEMEGSVMIFRGIEAGSAVFEQWRKHTRTAVLRVGIGERIGEYTVIELGSRDVTGLKAVKDPGFIPVLIALIVVAAGLSLALVQKRKDGKI
jgi:hypothetical protein